MDSAESTPRPPLTAAVTLFARPWDFDSPGDLRAVHLSHGSGPKAVAAAILVENRGSTDADYPDRVAVHAPPGGLSRDAAREVARYLVYFADHGRLPDGPLM